MRAWEDSQNVGNKIFIADVPYSEFRELIGANIDKFDSVQGTR